MRILHILRGTPGNLFYQVLSSQTMQHQLTIVLFPEADPGKTQLPGRILELAPRKKAGCRPRLHPLIDYQELLDLIFTHERVFCW
ncbi:MAG: hypothetical protein ACUVS3_07590 [Thermodesulfobacteriota bacterium]